MSRICRSEIRHISDVTNGDVFVTKGFMKFYLERVRIFQTAAEIPQLQRLASAN